MIGPAHAEPARGFDAKEAVMATKILAIAAVAGLLIGPTAIAQGQSRGGAGGGASAAAPRHEMKQPRASGERRARGAPRHSTETTGAGDRDDFTAGSAGRADDDDHVRHDTDGLMMDNDRRGIDKE